MQFSLDRDIESAAQDVNAAISKTLPLLPPQITPPSYRKQNPAAAPIVMIALTSNVLPLTQLDEYAETTIAQRLSMIEGVAQVNVFGSQKYAVGSGGRPRQARPVSTGRLAGGQPDPASTMSCSRLACCMAGIRR